MEGERRKMKKRRRRGGGERLVCGWNGEMIVRWIWGEMRGGACGMRDREE